MIASPGWPHCFLINDTIERLIFGIWPGIPAVFCFFSRVTNQIKIKKNIQEQDWRSPQTPACAIFFFSPRLVAAHIQKAVIAAENSPGWLAARPQSHMTREEFETLAADFWVRAARPLEHLIKRNNLKPEDIDAVELIGGGSRVPRIQAELSAVLNGRQLDRLGGQLV